MTKRKVPVSLSVQAVSLMSLNAGGMTISRDRWHFKMATERGRELYTRLNSILISTLN